MKTSLMLSAAVTTAIVAGSVIGSPQSVNATNAPTCSASDNVITVTPDNGSVMVASQSRVATNITIPAGTYNVSYQSYDGHSEHGGQGQNQEQWTFSAKVDTETIYTSTATQDIPEDVDTVTGSFGEVVLEKDANSVTFDHVIRQWKDAKTPESVYPVCVTFEKVAVEDPEVCEFDKTILATDENCEEPKVLGEIDPGETQLPNTGPAIVAAQALGLGAVSASVTALLSKRR